jgi:hypothetical protein
VVLVASVAGADIHYSAVVDTPPAALFARGCDDVPSAGGKMNPSCYAPVKNVKLLWCRSC